MSLLPAIKLFCKAALLTASSGENGANAWYRAFLQVGSGGTIVELYADRDRALSARQAGAAKLPRVINPHGTFQDILFVVRNVLKLSIHIALCLIREVR